MENNSDLNIMISNRMMGEDLKLIYGAKYNLKGRKMRLFFNGHEIMNQTPLYEVGLDNDVVIIIFIK